MHEMYHKIGVIASAFCRGSRCRDSLSMFLAKSVDCIIILYNSMESGGD